MLIDGQNVYMFNPFDMANWTEEEIKNQMDYFISCINNNTDVPYEIAKNIENISNQLFLIGECIARYTKERNKLKDEISAKAKVEAYLARDEYQNKNPNAKMPAMAYFEGIAEQKLLGDRNTLAELDCKLTRFKNAYNSAENICNSWKKLLEAIRYENGGK
jgi:hypothetical protein|nr:MAG TPA: hypothetical protein [Caudoviricetes sp.]